MSQVVADLIARGLVIEAELSATGVGRPGRLLELVGSRSYFVGTRIGETHVSSCVTDLRARVLRQVDTAIADTTPETVVAAIARHVEQLNSPERPISGLGICVAGQTRDGAVVRRAPFLDWHDLPLKDLVEDATGIRTQVDNDLTGLTQDEHWFGIGTTTTQFAVLALGAGIGLGVVANDARVTSPDDALGLVSHLPVSGSGQLCARGHRGCASAMLRPASVESAVSQGLNRPITFAEAVHMASIDENPVAVRVFEDAARALGVLLSLIANIALPEHIVITGEAAEIALLNRDLLESTLAENRHRLAEPVPLTVREFDPTYWARGAATRAIQAFAFRD